MRILALDVGTKRIGTAFADTASVKIAVPRQMIPVNGEEFAALAQQCRRDHIDVLVSGFPRNNQGEETAQTKLVQSFIIALSDYFVKHKLYSPLIKYQDESLTSVAAKERLSQQTSRALSFRDRRDGKIDVEAATIILQDFLDSVDYAALNQELGRHKLEQKARSLDAARTPSLSGPRESRHLASDRRHNATSISPTYQSERSK
ncbi:Holliday junction resolvase RuvX [Candidatus Saccharibacteria bacterium]|nr:Holliday junction resolvase RuvX [Candidatus Saccharibacteria bacterium]